MVGMFLVLLAPFNSLSSIRFFFPSLEFSGLQGKWKENQLHNKPNCKGPIVYLFFLDAKMLEETLQKGNWLTRLES